MNAIQLHSKLLDLGLSPCGSRHILSYYSQYDKDLEQSDYDFWCTTSRFEEIRQSLIDFGFSYPKEYSPNYCDAASISCTSTVKNGIKFEISIKKDAYKKVINHFWSIMENDPSLFAMKYWKRKTDRQLITQHINKFYEIMML